MVRFHSSSLHGFSKRRLREKRRRYELDGLTQVHHVLPRSLADHPVVRAHGYDVEGEYNFLLLPTREGLSQLRLRPERPLHDGGHMRYNQFARDGLDACVTHAKVDWVRRVGDAQPEGFRVEDLLRERNPPAGCGGGGGGEARADPPT